MLKIIIQACLFSVIATGTLSAQSYQGSKFLYGKAKTDKPFTIGIDAGGISSMTFFNKDYKNMDWSVGYGLSYNRPLSYRLAVEINLRAGQSLTGGDLNLPGDQVTALTQQTNYEVVKPVDLSGSLVYIFYHGRSGTLSIAGGWGLVHFKTNGLLGDSLTYAKRATFEGFIPVTLSGKTPLTKRLDLGAGYRYYFTFVDNFDVARLRNDLDKYSYAFLGLYYNFGTKGYKYQKKNECPTVN